MSLFRFFGSTPPPEATDDEGAAEAKPRASQPGNGHVPPTFDVIEVLERAGVKAEQRERVDRTLELLSALPPETPALIRKNIVEASLKAFDISIKAIVEAAHSEIVAFDAFKAEGHKALEELRQESQQRIRELEGEIAEIRRHLEVESSDQASLDHATQQAIQRVQPVLSFFREPAPKVDNDNRGEPTPSIIVDDSLTKTG
jgi:hypothetical protein